MARWQWPVVGGGGLLLLCVLGAWIASRGEASRGLPTNAEIESEYRCWAVGPSLPANFRGRPLKKQDYYVDATRIERGPTFSVYFDGHDRAVGWAALGKVWDNPDDDPDLKALWGAGDEYAARQHLQNCEKRQRAIDNFTERVFGETFNWRAAIEGEGFRKMRMSDFETQWARVTKTGQFVIEFAVITSDFSPQVNFGIIARDARYWPASALEYPVLP